MIQATKTPEIATMTLTSMLQDFVRYNAWANRRLVEWLKTKPAGLMDADVPSSFSSIRSTLVHIWDTERFWFAVLKQVPPPPSFRFTGFDGSLEEVFEGIVAQSDAFAAYFDGLSEDELQEIVSFTTPWVEGSRKRAEFAQHAMCHGLYHRGQIVTIGRNIGLEDAPMTDYSFYLLIG